MGEMSLAEKPIVPTAIDIMQQCRDEVHETVLIGTLAESQFVVMEQVLGSHPFKFSIDLGVQLEIHVSAPGKAMLAYLPEREVEKRLKGYRFVRYNEQTITSKRALMKELRAIRECGFGLDRGEQLHGIHCVSAPIFNRHERPIAAIWITGPIDRLPKEAFPDLGRTMRSYADQISERLL